MAKSLGKKEDLQHSLAKMDSGGSGDDFIKLDASTTYVTLLKADYAEVYEHWVPNPDKKKPKMRVACKGGVDAGGWAPDVCPICAEAAAKFDAKKKALADNDQKLAEQLNREGLDLRAGYRAFTVAAKGALVVERRNGKKLETFDFEDFDGKARLLPFTSAQMKLLIGIINNDTFPDIESGDDLVGKVLKVVKKEKQSKTGKSYGEVVEIVPVGKIELKVTGKVPNLDAFGEYDEKNAKKALAMYRGDTSSSDYGADKDAGGVDVDAAVQKAKAARAKKGK